MNYVWYRNVPAGPELSEMLHRQARIPRNGLACTPVRCRTATSTRCAGRRRTAGAGGRRGGHRHRHARTCRWCRTPGRRGWPTGRVALIGDAACGARPHAAAGTAKAAADGWALPARSEEADGDIAAALSKWEPAQLQLSDSLLDRVVAMGERSQFSNTWTPGDPDLRFGLYGPGR